MYEEALPHICMTLHPIPTVIFLLTPGCVLEEVVALELTFRYIFFLHIHLKE
jgi:hypothetical protein